MPDSLFVIGATGRIGVPLCRHLALRNLPFVAVVRDSSEWRGFDVPGERRVVDLGDVRSLAHLLVDTRRIICCAHARFIPGLLAAAHHDARLVLLGGAIRSAKGFNGDDIGVRAGEAAFMSSGRRGVMLHPAFLYGPTNLRAQRDRLRQVSFLVLPRGGRTNLQPVHEDDLAAAVVAAAETDWHGPRSIVLAGPEKVTVAGYLRALAHAGQAKVPRIIGAPGLLQRAVGGLGEGPELQLPFDEQAFPPQPFTDLIARAPMALATGLERAFT